MDQNRSPTRRLRIFLRDFRMVEATVSFADGQSLASFFAHRKSYLNLREAFWPGTGERADHAVLKVEQVSWASSADADIPLSHASAPTTGRLIEVQLDGGLLLRARLIISNQQRLSDYLDAAGRFLPMQGAQLLRSGRPPRRVNVQLGDIVLNQEGIQAAWETELQTDAAARTPLIEAAEPVSVTLPEETLPEVETQSAVEPPAVEPGSYDDSTSEYGPPHAAQYDAERSEETARQDYEPIEEGGTPDENTPRW